MSRDYHVHVDDDPDREANILQALVGPHHRLWHTSPEFHASMLTLSRALPILVEVLAQDATNVAVARELAVIEQLRNPPGPVTTHCTRSDDCSALLHSPRCPKRTQP